MHAVQRTYEYLLQGGWVMIPLGAASVVLWALMIERLTTLGVLRREDVTIDDAIQAVRKSGSGVTGEGLRARLVGSFLAERTGFPRLDVDILKRCAMEERKGLGRSLAVIGVLVAVAPLLGLLGTVLGMIETFQVISVYGTGNANAMANGISVALITTETGLLIAVPGLLLSGLLLQQSSRLTTRLEEDVTILSRVVRRHRCASVDVRRFGATTRDDRSEPEPAPEPVAAVAGEADAG